MGAAAAPTSNIELYRDEALADPYPGYDELRRLGPAVWLESYGLFALPRFADCKEALDSIGIEVGGLLNEDDLVDAADALEPNSSAAMIVWENVWARKVAQAMRDAGGQPVAFERLPHDVVQAAREWALEQDVSARAQDSSAYDRDGKCDAGMQANGPA